MRGLKFSFFLSLIFISAKLHVVIFFIYRNFYSDLSYFQFSIYLQITIRN